MTIEDGILDLITHVGVIQSILIDAGLTTKEKLIETHKKLLPIVEKQSEEAKDTAFDQLLQELK